MLRKKEPPAPRKKERQRFIVKIVRTIEHTAEVEVEAMTGEEARKLAVEQADAPNSNVWREGDVVDEYMKTTALRLGSTS